ncbi:ABC transporter substrate-binding protein [Microbacterium kribbense]|uniref:ABC transporter substrate-binding protein n=1 Tax=Microbacterium kribbense TaxID=433645 RepID=A0ABP7G2J0_9MICO
MNLHHPRRTARARGVLGALAVASAVALAVSGCARSDGGARGGAASAPGITDTTVTIGISSPLSGPVAGPGTCTADGAIAYFEARNAEGGITFGEGKTRTVKVTALDDQYDPQKAKANYDQFKGSVFAIAIGLGTPTNRAFREAAIADGVPQVLTGTGDPLFSDRAQSPMQLDAFPTYVEEGRAFGEMLVASGEHKVAILSQNDDYGLDYLTGFKSAVQDAPGITITKELTYEVPDVSLDAQITALAATGADVIFNAVSQPHLTVSAMQKAQALNWLPSWFLPSNTSGVAPILKPAGADVFPNVYTIGYHKTPDDPAYANDPDVKAFTAALAEYTKQPAIPEFPHCMWGYMAADVLGHTFQQMTEPTRAEFMTQLLSIKGYQTPLMLPGAEVDTTIDGEPAISSVILERFDGTGYDPIDALS